MYAWCLRVTISSTCIQCFSIILSIVQSLVIALAILCWDERIFILDKSSIYQHITKHSRRLEYTINIQKLIFI